jgi:hypothetical protein
LAFLSHSVIAVARPKNMNEFLQSWRHRDHFELTKLLAYPSCCRTSFLANVEHVDSVWAAAVRCATTDSRLVEMSQPGLTNMLLMPIGLYTNSHISCSFDCKKSIAVENLKRELVARALPEFVSVWDTLNEVLAWPMEWSALHGIAEIRTPVFTICKQTVATANEYIVRTISRSRPAESAYGLRFPYLGRERAFPLKVLNDVNHCQG